MNAPNALTLLRILLVPGFLIAVIHDAVAVALVLFVIAGITDVLDGFLARILSQKTVLGQYLDPMADKLLMTVSYVALAIKGLLPPWLAVLVVSKDVFIALGVGILYFAGYRQPAAPSNWGKATTFMQALTAGLVLTTGVWREWQLSPWFFFLTGGMTATAGLLYILLGFRNLPRTETPPPDVIR